MNLTSFTTTLLQSGQVTIPKEFSPLDPADLTATTKTLSRFHETDKLHLPTPAPAFDPTAALWSAQYLYRATQLTLLRDAGDEAVSEHLLPYEGEMNAHAIYSADLVLRHLPELLGLAKGLAPDDVLVVNLHATAARWPFSSVGIAIDAHESEAIILDDPALRIAYADRIIQARDRKRLENPLVEELVREALGDHKAALWPELV